MSTGADKSDRPVLTLVRIGADPQAWEGAGFTVSGHAVAVGGVTIELTAPLGGIGALGFAGLPDGAGDLDGIPLEQVEPLAEADHANGVVAVDQLVIATPDFDRTATVMAGLGLGLTREVVRENEDGNEMRQGFVRSGDAVLELVTTVNVPGSNAHGWGLGFVSERLDAVIEELEGLIGPARPAVQPGRRIAVFHRDANLGLPVVLMDPEPREGDDSGG